MVGEFRSFYGWYWQFGFLFIRVFLLERASYLNSTNFNFHAGLYRCHVILISTPDVNPSRTEIQPRYEDGIKHIERKSEESKIYSTPPTPLAKSLFTPPPYRRPFRSAPSRPLRASHVKRSIYSFALTSFALCNWPLISKYSLTFCLATPTAAMSSIVLGTCTSLSTSS